MHADSAVADNHYNRALRCGQLRGSRKAIRHVAQYRRQTESRSI